MKDWKKNIRVVQPYIPGEQPDRKDMIKLNTNENPYPPAREAASALRDWDPDALRLYPDPAGRRLTDAIAEYYGVDKACVFAGVGSDDVLATAFLTFFHSGKPILFPDISYSFYEVWARLFEIPYEKPPLTGDFRIRPEDYYKENGGVVIANPNAPTSIYEGPDFIEDIVRHNQDSVVIVDEAYIDFGGSSALCLLNQYENLLVTQTFSKSRSMAGLRIGYAFGSRELIQAMNDVKFSYNSYTLNLPSLIVGEKVLKNKAYFKETTAKIIHTRERTKERLSELGFSFPDSRTNFLFIRHLKAPAKELFVKLREKDIFVRYFDAPRIDDYLRVTIGTDAQMDIFLEAVKNLIG